MDQHKKGKGSKFIRGFGFGKLLYHEAHATKSKAFRREAEIKSWNRVKKEALIAGIGNLGHNMKYKALFSWSSGKDSAYALHMVLKELRFEVVSLLTTVTDDYQRISMHGVREKLLDLQAKSIGIPLAKIRIPRNCTNEIYEEKMATFLKPWKQKGVEHVIFGDIFLEDLRKYREEKLALLGMKAIFPIWKRPTKMLAREMIQAGFQARLACIDPKKLAKDFSGRPFDASLLKDLPKGIDPCGENGEFHTFVHGGPIFKKRIGIERGQTVEHDGFVFTDFYPA